METMDVVLVYASDNNSVRDLNIGTLIILGNV